MKNVIPGMKLLELPEVLLTSDGNMKIVYASGSGWQESELNASCISLNTSYILTKLQDARSAYLLNL